MLFFSHKKLDPIVKLKLKEKTERTLPVIVIFKSSLTKGFITSLIKNKGKIKHELGFMNAIAAQLTLDTIDRLSELPEVFSISYDRKARVTLDKTINYVGITNSNPYNLTGRNVTAAIIDTGVYPHADLLRPVKAVTYFKDMVNSINEWYDDNGHGTFMCGLISGSGSMSDGKYKGIAPGCRLIMIKAFNSVGEGSFSDILSSMGWVVENRERYNIKLLCLPFGADVIVPHTEDPLCLGAKAASDTGIIVITSAGNKGPANDSITTPGIEPSSVTVGCCNCRDSNIRNWSISDFSGRGSKKERDTKPDITAPGFGITSLASNSNFIPAGDRRISPPSPEIPYGSVTGTSASAAVATGCIALYLEKSPNLTSKDLKGILKLSCQTINDMKNAQGYGVINMKKLLNE
ncbi:serine protease AprX [Oxobacter pfennigii]|uniref:Serine protease AprX n=1 Tax=Oxobacter pfennigii TaxID=36849 RepID=A0A0P8W2T6_9CLOT|nr:S8 family peptidase [Oxobacter pfennigii]KPU42854.1 serine protease AprX [Oxobacter pfennigii]